METRRGRGGGTEDRASRPGFGRGRTAHVQQHPHPLPHVLRRSHSARPFFRDDPTQSAVSQHSQQNQAEAVTSVLLGFRPSDKDSETGSKLDESGRTRPSEPAQTWCVVSRQCGSHHLKRLVQLSRAGLREIAVKGEINTSNAAISLASGCPRALGSIGKG